MPSLHAYSECIFHGHGCNTRVDRKLVVNMQSYSSAVSICQVQHMTSSIYLCCKTSPLALHFVELFPDINNVSRRCEELDVIAKVSHVSYYFTMSSYCILYDLFIDVQCQQFSKYAVI
jgi:hypothetical protein